MPAVAHAGDLRVELPLDVGRHDLPLHPGGDEVLPRGQEARRRARAATATVAGSATGLPPDQRQVDADAEPGRLAEERARPGEVVAVAEQRRAGHDAVAVGPQDAARDGRRHPEVIGVDHEAN